MTFPMFLSCFKWNPEVEEWEETGQSVNLDQVHWFGVAVVESHPMTYGIRADFGGGEHPNRAMVVQGAPTREMACAFFSALLANIGIPHFPPLADVDIEVARKPGGLAAPPGSNN